MILALRAEHPDIAALLLDRGASPQACDLSGNTILKVAAWHTPRLVPRLLAAGVDVNKTDNDGATALMDASMLGGTRKPSDSAEVVRLLLQHRARPEVKDLGGKTALAYAVQDKNWPVVMLLKKTGAKE